MSLLKNRLAATDEKLAALKEARKTADKARRKTMKESRADRERKLRLIGEAVLQRVASGEWDEDDFRTMMDAALARPADRALFELEESDN
ncbi:hypothetical protein AB870_25070 (plasmid) [Pandoraea faecigallinarum]|uniref:Mobilization protein n=1 Tax=Pandoraea faecigallinarum TaxID=656179 RepID=A0A173H062_9BURK|nr:hypothetical protein [Pandoraea faecigallinarum]ANI21835.1 hypothetical protein AB870_25070 [Pandoraea faecigallinarum]